MGRQLLTPGPSSVKVRRGVGGRQPGCPSGRRLVTGREGTVEREGAAGGGRAPARVPVGEAGRHGERGAGGGQPGGPGGKTARPPGVRGPSSVKVRRGAGGRQPGCPPPWEERTR